MGAVTVNAMTIICLALLGAVATWGVFSRHVDDTLGQRVGLSVVAIGCFTRLAQRLVYDMPSPPIETLVILFGVTVYAVSTAVKVICARRRSGERRRRGAAHGC